LHFATNGLLAAKITKGTKEILAQKPNRLLVSISLDGPPEIHDRLRGIKGNWRQAIRLFKILRKINQKNFGVFFGMTLSQFNADLVNQTINSVREEIPEVSFDDFHFNLAQTSPHFYFNQDIKLNLDKKFIDSLSVFKIKKRLKRADFFSLSKLGVGFLESQYQKLAFKYLGDKKTPLPCQALSASIFIDPQGSVYPCSIWDRKLGNLLEIGYDLRNIWTDDQVLKTREKILRYQCPNCWTPCEAYQTILGNLFFG